MHDPCSRLVVWGFTGETLVKAQWTRHLADIRALRAWPAIGPRPSVLVYIADGAFVPNAVQRRELAEETGKPGFAVDLAMVSCNADLPCVMRGVGWLQRWKPYRIRTFTELAAGIRWLAHARAEARPSAMHNEITCGLLYLLQQLHSTLDTDRAPLHEARNLLWAEPQDR